MKYVLFLLLSASSLSAIEKYTIQEHMSVADKHNLILSTISGDKGVDCGVFSIEDNKPQLLLSTHIKNEDIQTFSDAIKTFLSYVNEIYGMTIQYACFAGPGVPSADQDYLQHWRLPYVINAKEIIAQNDDLISAIIVNDFLALSYGVNFVDDNKITTLYDASAEKNGKRVIIGAGAGLGTVSMIWNDEQKTYISFPAEAGTGDFPALDAFELELSLRMREMRNFKTIHWAFFVAQPGIECLYRILQDMNYKGCSSDKNYSDAMNILANAQDDACCAKAAELFYTFYARFVYNFVWNTLPFGGIYLVGETATEHPEMLSSIFLPAYFSCVESKRPLLQRIPVYIIKDDITMGLYGTTNYFLIEKKELLQRSSFLNELQTKALNYWNAVKDRIVNLF